MEQTLAVLVLSGLIEFLIEHYVKKPLGEEYKKYSRFIPYLAGIIGIVICIVFTIDIFQEFGITSEYRIATQILSGLVISAGSVGWHKVLKYVEVKTEKEEKEL